MFSNVFDVFKKQEAARTKWERLSHYQRELVGMRFIQDMLSPHGHRRILHYGEKVLSDGRSLTILHMEIGIGEFAFALPRYTDSYLILMDFDLCEELLYKEGVIGPTPN